MENFIDHSQGLHLQRCLVRFMAEAEGLRSPSIVFFFYAQHFSMSGSHWTSVGFRLDRWSVSFLCKISVWSEERLPLSWLLAVCCTNFQLSAVCFNIAVFLKVQALSKEVDNIYTSTDRVVKNIHLIHFQGFSKSGSGTILDIMKY